MLNSTMNPLSFDFSDFSHSIDNLVALYLLELSSQDTADIRTLKPVVQREAEKEYSKIKGAPSALPQDPALLRIELRRILSPSAAK